MCSLIKWKKVKKKKQDSPENEDSLLHLHPADVDSIKGY